MVRGQAEAVLGDGEQLGLVACVQRCLHAGAECVQAGPPEGEDHDGTVKAGVLAPTAVIACEQPVVRPRRAAVAGEHGAREDERVGRVDPDAGQEVRAGVVGPGCVATGDGHACHAGEACRSVRRWTTATSAKARPVTAAAAIASVSARPPPTAAEATVLVTTKVTGGNPPSTRLAGPPTSCRSRAAGSVARLNHGRLRPGRSPARGARC
jgi:hypothetical protein